MTNYVNYAKVIGPVCQAQPGLTVDGKVRGANPDTRVITNGEEITRVPPAPRNETSSHRSSEFN